MDRLIIMMLSLLIRPRADQCTHLVSHATVLQHPLCEVKKRKPRSNSLRNSHGAFASYTTATPSASASVSAGVTHREEGDDTSSYTRHIKPDTQTTHTRQAAPCRHRTPCIKPARQPGRSRRASETPRCEDGASAGQRRRRGLRRNDRELFRH